MRTYRFTSFALTAVAACSGFTEPSGPPKQLSSLPRELSASEQLVSQAANQFALTLFKRLSEAQPDSNVFVSPLSVSFSLGMAMNGADGTTLDEMRSTLGFGDLELAAINDGYRGLMSLQRGLDPSTTFQIANSVWYRQAFPFHQSFIDTVRSAFDADVRGSDFGPATVTQVNDWVKSKTNGKIEEILERIKDTDVMFLINAIYFKGSWRDRFDPAKTRDATFHAIDGATQTAKLMHRASGEGKVRFRWTPAASVGELVYGNSAFVMTVVLPNAGHDVTVLAAELDTASWAATTADLPEQDVEVYFPKIRLEYERALKHDLSALGMRVPFIPQAADFTLMSPVALANQLHVSFVQHKTFVDINEEGTEAAAVTNTGMGVVSMPPSLRVDRPFIFAIRERFSGTILFIGKIVRIPE